MALHVGVVRHPGTKAATGRQSEGWDDTAASSGRENAT